MNKLEILKKSELFDQLTDEELKTIEPVGSEEIFEPGAIICKQDTKEQKIFIIEDGLVAICLDVGQLDRRQIQSVGKLETFGWMAMIEPFQCFTTTTAIKRTNAISFDGKKLYDFCTANPVLGLKITRALVRIVRKRLRQAYTQLLGVSF